MKIVHKYSTLLLLFSLTVFSLKAQNQNNIWYFGGNAGLDFNSGAPVALTNGALFSNEGCASISDASGNVLFYTEGLTVWDRTHSVMPNGTGLLGNLSASQSATIVPIPGSPGLFYIFTVDELGGALRYSVVNMALNGGNGDVTGSKNILLHPTVDEKIAVIKKCDGNYWVITHEWGSNKFFADLVTTSGISPSVTSNAGPVHTGGSHPNYNTVGCMKASQQGNKLALAVRDLNHFELFDFNISTGVVSNAIILSPSGGVNLAYGVEFSPDGSKLYGTSYLTRTIYQFNMLAGSPAAIAASGVVVGTTTSDYPCALQIGPDNKIYVAKAITYSTGPNFVSAINNPNASGGACNFVNNAVSLGTKFCLAGLPGFIVYANAITPNDFIATNTCSGSPTDFTLTSASADSVSWNFGDGIIATFPNNASHTYSTAGIYTVTALVYLSCGTQTIPHTVIIVAGSPVLASPDSQICGGQNITIFASGSASYQWTGGTSSTNASLSVSPTVTTSYYVAGTNTCGVTHDTVVITVIPLPVLNIAGSAAICNGQSTTLTASGGASYQWSGGSAATSASITVTPAATTGYIVMASNSFCTSVDSVNVIVDTSPVVITAAADTVCAGTAATLSTTGAASYAWAGGGITASTSSVTVAPITSTTYTLTGTNGGCSAMPITVNVLVNPLPVIGITGTELICEGSTHNYSGTASGGTAPYQYVWSTGVTAPAVTLTPTAVNTTLSVFVSDANACVDMNTITIVSVPDPIAILPVATSGCTPFDVTFLNEATNAVSYNWNFGDGATSTLQYPVHEYGNVGTYDVTLITTNLAGCSDTLVSNAYITTSPSPVAGITTSGDITIENPVLTVSDNSQLSDNCILYFGDGASLPSCGWNTTTHIYAEEGNYTITQIVTSANGCADTAETTVNVLYEDTFYAPNAFTPNSNGSNDVFYVYGTGLTNFKLEIYDRWGEKIFESDSQYKGWDGTYKGNPVQQDVYEWKAYYGTRRRGKVERMGSVTVVR